MEVPLVFFIMLHIVCISPTLYGAVETLEVNESTMSSQHNRTEKEMDGSPILLLNRTPSSSSGAFSGKVRPL
jgi:hypothetical protein